MGDIDPDPAILTQLAFAGVTMAAAIASTIIALVEAHIGKTTRGRLAAKDFVLARMTLMEQGEELIRRLDHLNSVRFHHGWDSPGTSQAGWTPFSYEGHSLYLSRQQVAEWVRSVDAMADELKAVNRSTLAYLDTLQVTFDAWAAASHPDLHLSRAYLGRVYGHARAVVGHLKQFEEAQGRLITSAFHFGVGPRDYLDYICERLAELVKTVNETTAQMAERIQHWDIGDGSPGDAVRDS